MKKILIILTVMVAVMLTSSCQKELPDAVKNVDVSQGDKIKVISTLYLSDTTKEE